MEWDWIPDSWKNLRTWVFPSEDVFRRVPRGLPKTKPKTKPKPEQKPKQPKPSTQNKNQKKARDILDDALESIGGNPKKILEGLKSPNFIEQLIGLIALLVLLFGLIGGSKKGKTKHIKINI